MGGDIGVVVDGTGSQGNIEVGQRPIIVEAVEQQKPMYERLLDAAKQYLKEAGIRLPYSDLEVTKNDEVVMHGVPFSGGPMLVCAYNEGGGIQNCL